jgi:hypothetical protein
VSAALRIQLENERRSLGRTLHGEIAADLAAVILELALLQRASPDELARDADPSLQRAQLLLGRCVKTVSGLERVLRPPLLEEAGLGPALRWLASAQAPRDHPVELQLPSTVPRLSPQTEWEAFRSVEAVLGQGLRPRPRRLLEVEVRGPVLLVRLIGRPAVGLSLAVATARSRLVGLGRVTAAGSRADRVTVELRLAGGRSKGAT